MQTKQYMKKIIILTAGPLTDDKAWLIRKLQASAQCQVVAVCIDEKPTNWWRRMQFLRRAWGSRQWLQAILYRLRQMATCEVPKRLWWGWHDLWLPPQPAATYEDLEVQQSTHIYRVPDIHAPETLSMLRDLLPDLGVIIGGRPNALTMIPILGLPFIGQPPRLMLVILLLSSLSRLNLLIPLPP
jgi:hypothetical protein